MPSSKNGDNSAADWASYSQHSMSTAFDEAQRGEELGIDANEAIDVPIYDDEILWGCDPNTSYVNYMMESEKAWKQADQDTSWIGRDKSILDDATAD